MAIDVCFYFQVHQPWRLRHYRFLEVGHKHDYFDDALNAQILRKPAILRDKLIEERQVMLGARQDEETTAAGGASTDDKALATAAARIIFF